MLSILNLEREHLHVSMVGFSGGLRISQDTRSSASHICESLTMLCYHNFYLWTTLRLELLCARQQWPIVIGVLGC